MIKFEKLDAVETSKLRKSSVVTVILILILAGSIYVTQLLRADCMSKEEANEKYIALVDENKLLEKDVAALKVKIAGLSGDTISDATISKEELVSAIGACAQSAGSSLTGLSSRDISQDVAVTKYNFSFELRGTFKQISDTLSRMDSKQYRYAVNEMSLRQSANYSWLQRDATNQITWWDQPTAIDVDSETIHTLAASDFMGIDTMSLYLDLDFIFVTANSSEQAE